MTERSARFALPLLQPGQAQKEVFHNEALTAVALLIEAAVECPRRWSSCDSGDRPVLDRRCRGVRCLDRP